VRKFSNPWVLRAGLIAACFLGLFASVTNAQLVRIEAGASDLLPSAGGSIGLQGPNYTGYFGAGDLRGAFGLGAYFRTTVGSDIVTLGDQPIPFDLPTDIFDVNHFFLARGIGIAAREGKANVFLFAGGTAVASGTPFFQSAKADLPAAILFADAPLSPSLHFYSRSVISWQLTTIEALDWRPRKWLRSGFAGGIGGNRSYLAATADIERDWWSLKMAYISASDRFRRITAPSIFASESDRENILAQIRPSSSILLTLGHQNFLQPQSIDPTAALLHATVNQMQSDFLLREFRVGAGIFQSTYQNRSNAAENLSVGRKITDSLDMSASYFRTISGIGPHTSNLSASVREILSPRLSLLQVINYSQGRTNVLYGGSYLSNRFTLSVDYQTLYLPFRANPYSQGISVTLRIRLFGSLQLNAQTFWSADGRLRYTASGNTLMTSHFRPAAGGGESAFRHMRYIVRGRVQDEQGSPVEGAAVRIGEAMVLTNAAGEFFLRRQKAAILPVQVAFGEFLNVASFRVISAPLKVTASPDSAASEILIILGRN